jgi:hypothetical protein
MGWDLSAHRTQRLAMLTKAAAKHARPKWVMPLEVSTDDLALN